MRPGSWSGRDLVQRLEAGIAVGLQEAGERRHVRGRVLGATVWAVEISRGRRGFAAERPIVADIDPKPSGFGPPKSWFQHRNRGVVTMDLLGGKDVFADPRDHRIKQPGGLAHPIGQG